MEQNRRSVLRAAEKLASRGKLEAAIRQYRKVLKATPDDTRTLNRVGDLFARLNRRDEAVEIFSQAAERFVDDGFLVKAIAILKKIIRLDPRQIGIYERLADLYHRQGLRNEALSQYHVVADYYAQARDSQKVLAIYEKMVELEPENLSHRVKLAELYCAASKVPAALGQYQKIASFMLEHGKVDEALKVYRGALDLSPDDLGFLTDVVLHLKDSGKADAAEQLLTQAIEKNPEAARVREVAGLIEPGRSVPSDQLQPPESTFEGGLQEDAGVETARWEADELPQTPEKASPAPGLEEPRSKEPRRAEDAGSESGEEVEDEEVVVLEVEADDGELPDVVESGAATVDSLSRADELEIDLEALEESAAVKALEEVVEDTDQSRPDAEDRAVDERELSTSERPDVARPEEVAVEEAAGEAPGPEAPGETTPVPPADDARAPLEVRGEEEMFAVDAEDSVGERLSEARMLLSYGLNQKAADLYLKVLGEVPDHLEAHDLLIDLLQQDGDFDAVAEAAHRAREALGASSSAWIEIEERLEQWDYRVEAGKISPPAKVRPTVEVDSADAPAVIEQPSQPVWLGTDDEEVVDSSDDDEIFGAEDEFFDLAAELEEELRQEEKVPGGEDEIVPRLEEQSLEEIVEGFKQGVADTLSEEDFETHYNLGIAYREMGLVDEAIGEFQLAAKSSDHLVDCCSLLGSCFVEKGFPDLAIKWYERGLEAPQVSEMESLGLLYELGNLHLMTGENDVARKTFAEIYGINSNYRDVVAKLEELRST